MMVGYKLAVIYLYDPICVHEKYQCIAIIFNIYIYANNYSQHVPQAVP